MNLNPPEPSSHFLQSCSQPNSPQPVLVYGIAPSQTQDFPLGFVQLHSVPLRPERQDVSEWQLPLSSVPVLGSVFIPSYEEKETQFLVQRTGKIMRSEET